MSELVQLRRPEDDGPAAGAAPARGPSRDPVRPVSRKVYIETYGCQMNINDTELMAGVLADAGYLRVDEPGDADVVLVNTCAVREHAERRVRGRIGQLQQHRDGNGDLVLGVTGCMAQRIGDDLVEIEGVEIGRAHV